MEIVKGKWKLVISSSGSIESMTNGELELVNQEDHQPLLTVGAGPAGSVTGGPSWTAQRELSLEGIGVIDRGFRINYGPSDQRPLQADLEISIKENTEGLVVLDFIVRYKLLENIEGLVTIQIRKPLCLRSNQRTLEYANKAGQLVRYPVVANQRWGPVFLMGPGSGLDNEQQFLAIPLVDETVPDSPNRLACSADPYWTTGFGLGADGGGWFSFQVPGDQNWAQPTRRHFVCALHQGSFEEALHVMYQTVLSDVPAGPEWIHDIGWLHWDYLSHGGNAWFADLGKLGKVIRPEEHSRVGCVAHGVFDIYGRNCYDHAAGRIIDNWKCFENVKEWQTWYPNARTVEMSRSKLCERLKYSRDLGFKTMLYFTDGMVFYDGCEEVFHPDKVLCEGKWRGPETCYGEPYNQNPLHPDVRKWYLGYANALMEAYGDLVHGLVWDETFHIRAEHIAKGPYPGYAAPGMMTLVKEVAAVVHSHKPDVAIFASDNLGYLADRCYWDRPPYALVADGNHQDAECRPWTFLPSFWPSYRNVSWSLNWRSLSSFPWTVFGVLNFRNPVCTATGFQDDAGADRLTNTQLERFIELFETWKHLGHLRDRIVARSTVASL